MNKQKVITGFILLLAFTYAKGQDRIITMQNDTVFCRIVSILQNHIRYEQKIDNGNTMGKFIPIDQVREYYLGSKRQEIPFTPSLLKSKRSKEPFDRWRVGIQGGGAYLLASTTRSKQAMQNMGIPKTQVNEYHKQLRNGMNVGADIHYLITPFCGVGIRYSLFTTSIQMDLTVKEDDYYTSIPIYYVMGLKEKIYMNYIGPSVVFQLGLDKNRKFKLSQELSLGYATYRDEERFDPYKYLFLARTNGFPMYNILTEGNTLGGNIKSAFEYYPLPWLSIEANIGIFSAAFRSVKISTNETSITQDLGKDDYLNMSRFDYSIGIRFHF